MSWSTKGKFRVNPDKSVDDKWERENCDTDRAGAENANAMREAKKAAKSLLETGLFGFGVFEVDLSGHANPRNEYRDGCLCGTRVRFSIEQFLVRTTADGDRDPKFVPDASF